MADATHETQQVSPVQSTAAGLAAFLGGQQAAKHVVITFYMALHLQPCLLVQVLQ